MRKIVSCAIAVSILASVPAQAGEVTGNGKSTPIRDYIASSICSFSGLNDDPEEDGLFIQTFGWVMRFFGVPPGTPGQTCRGNR